MTTQDQTAMMLGANLTATGATFAVWAPNAATSVTLELRQDDEARAIALQPGGDGLWAIEVPGVQAGAHYTFRLDDGPGFPDPYSRYQPEGVHGASEVVDPAAFAWTDAGWEGPDPDRLVIYELHVGTMTPEGTFRQLIDQLPELAELGVTMIELMPVAQCPGRWNWGYDGAQLFAPSHAYGRPDDLRSLVTAAHGLGLGVMLDVVYNHFGPEGAYQGAYARQYFSQTHHTDWGAGLNWDAEGSEWVRRYALDNVRHWIAEYHLDGLRLDATHALVDDSARHIVQEIAEVARNAAGSRRVVIHAEDGRHDITRARPVAHGGDGADGVWADDFHHEVRVLLTNAHENYFASYSGSTAALAATIDGGFGPVTTGKNLPAVGKDDPAAAFIFCIQNHDQVGNRPFGERLHHEANADRYSVASTLLLFAPETPLLFMGQEFAASTPFLYFTDHPEELGRLVTEGRRAEFSGFGVFHDPHLRETIPDPQAEQTFLASKLRLNERESNADVYAMYRELLRLRRDDPVLRMNDRQATRSQALTAACLVVHRSSAAGHRVLVANVGPETSLDLSSIAGVPHGQPTLLMTTTDARFGGSGEQPVVDAMQLTLPARSATIWAVE